MWIVICPTSATTTAMAGAELVGPFSNPKAADVWLMGVHCPPTTLDEPTCSNGIALDAHAIRKLTPIAWHRGNDRE